ncbi:MAG: metal ABC transporter permease [Clostridia bacterium]|nr:metal ABC transporter permease [Clostridia bacterium]
MDLIYLLLEKIFPFSWVEFNFMKNAFVAILLITPLFGLIGTMIVNNKMSFFSDALGHCALTGIALGVILNITNYSVSMILFSVLFALGISGIMQSEVSSSDTIISVFSSTGIALGIFLLSFSGNFAKYSAYLVGDILSINKNEIFILLLILILVIITWILLFNKLLLSGLNSDMAHSKRINVKFYKNLFSVLIAIIVTVCLKWVGILMINSLLILPAASSRNIAKNMRSYHVLSVIFSVFSGIFGLILSYYIGASAGSTIVLVSSVIFFVTFFVNKIK